MKYIYKTEDSYALYVAFLPFESPPPPPAAAALWLGLGLGCSLSSPPPPLPADLGPLTFLRTMFSPLLGD